MKKMNMLDLVKGRVKFDYYRDGNFFYSCENGFQFPVQLDDIGQATLLSEDKAIIFMRWIRKHLKTIEAGNVTEFVGMNQEQSGGSVEAMN